MTARAQSTRDGLVIMALQAAEGFPLSTRQVKDTVHPSVPSGAVLGILHRLAGAGQIERVTLPASVTYYWRW